MSKLRLIQGLKIISVMHNFKANFDKVFNIIKPLVLDCINIHDNFIHSNIMPKLSDLQLVTINLVSEYMSMGSENLLFKKLKDDKTHNLDQLIERSVYNKRRQGNRF